MEDAFNETIVEANAIICNKLNFVNMKDVNISPKCFLIFLKMHCCKNVFL